jgi:predicted small secreted protein
MRLTFLCFALSLLLTSCETVKGVGRDIEKLGEAIDDAVSGD